jgi:hypothetical protein
MIKEKNTLKSTQSKYALELEDYLVYIQSNFYQDRHINTLALSQAYVSITGFIVQQADSVFSHRPKEFFLKLDYE